MRSLNGFGVADARIVFHGLCATCL
jgi:hypothetical protein